ncbi:MAG: TIGR02147 family protein [Bdellovibrionota bacterium]
MKIYEFSDYKAYVNQRVENMPNKGRGQFRKFAELLSVNSVVVSQIFKGARELSLEQANILSNYFGMGELEKEYFFLLVQKGRTSNHELTKYYDQKLKKIAIEMQDVKNIVTNERLSEETQSLFYSNWYYSAIRLSTLIPGNENADKIAAHLSLPIHVVQKVMTFLLNHKLAVEEKGKIKIGPQRTHIEASSPFVNRHHINWRLKGIEHMDNLHPDELFYTSPMTLSAKSMNEIKKMLLKLVVDMSEEVKLAKDEKIACLNIDFFELDK